MARKASTSLCERLVKLTNKDDMFGDSAPDSIYNINHIKMTAKEWVTYMASLSTKLIHEYNINYHYGSKENSRSYSKSHIPHMCEDFNRYAVSKLDFTKRKTGTNFISNFLMAQEMNFFSCNEIEHEQSISYDYNIDYSTQVVSGLWVDKEHRKDYVKNYLNNKFGYDVFDEKCELIFERGQLLIPPNSIIVMVTERMLSDISLERYVKYLEDYIGIKLTLNEANLLRQKLHWGIARSKQIHIDKNLSHYCLPFICRDSVFNVSVPIAFDYQSLVSNRKISRKGWSQNDIGAIFENSWYGPVDISENDPFRYVYLLQLFHCNPFLKDFYPRSDLKVFYRNKKAIERKGISNKVYLENRNFDSEKEHLVSFKTLKTHGLPANNPLRCFFVSRKIHQEKFVNLKDIDKIQYMVDNNIITEEKGNIMAGRVIKSLQDDIALYNPSCKLDKEYIEKYPNYKKCDIVFEY